MNFLKSKKGQLSQLGALGTGLAAMIIVFAVVFLILAQTRSQIITAQPTVDASNESTWTPAFNSTVVLTNAAATVPPWMPLIVIAVIGSILLGLVALFRRR